MLLDLFLKVNDNLLISFSRVHRANRMTHMFLVVLAPIEFHQVDGHKQGPNLHACFGRVSGLAAGYSYTEANKKSGMPRLKTRTGWGFFDLSKFVNNRDWLGVSLRETVKNSYFEFIFNHVKYT